MASAILISVFSFQCLSWLQLFLGVPSAIPLDAFGTLAMEAKPAERKANKVNSQGLLKGLSWHAKHFQQLAGISSGSNPLLWVGSKKQNLRI